MDDTDLRIIEVLQENARTSLKEIAAKICLSVPATSERLRRLKDSGVIRSYTVLLEGGKFGKEFQCFCFVTLGNHDSHKNKPFFDYVEHQPDILECHCIAGKHEYLMKISTQSPKTLEKMLAELRDCRGVVKTDTCMVLSTIKELPSVRVETAART